MQSGILAVRFKTPHPLTATAAMAVAHCMHTHIESLFLFKHFRHLHTEKTFIHMSERVFYVEPWSIYSLELTGHINTTHRNVFDLFHFHRKPTVMNKTGQFQANVRCVHSMN